MVRNDSRFENQNILFAYKRKNGVTLTMGSVI